MPATLSPSANRFLPSSQFVDEQHFGVHFNCESDGLRFSQIKLGESQAVIWPKHFQPLRRIASPLLNRFRRQRMVEFRKHRGRNQNSLVRPVQEFHLPDQNKVVNWRGVRDDNHFESGLKLSFCCPELAECFPILLEIAAVTS